MKKLLIAFTFFFSFYSFAQHFDYYYYAIQSERESNQSTKALKHLLLGKASRHRFFNPQKNYKDLAGEFQKIVNPTSLHRSEMDIDLVDDSTFPFQAAIGNGNCPVDLKVLSFNKENIKPFSDNSLSFTNKIHNYQNIKDLPPPTFNYCLGHSQVTTALRYLSYFDPDNKLKLTLYEKDTPEWRTFIISQLKILFEDNKVVTFPYIKNIRELSQKFTDQIKYYVAWSWFHYTVNWSNLIYSYKNKQTFHSQTIENLIISLKHRIASGQQPLIIINPWGEMRGHGLLVYKIEHTKNGYQLHVDDSNIEKVSNNDAIYGENTVEIRKVPGKEKFLITYIQDTVSEDPKTPENTHRLGRIQELEFNKKFYARAVESIANQCQKSYKSSL